MTAWSSWWSGCWTCTNASPPRRRLAAAQTPHDKELLQRQIAATDQHIDRLVYELYELTEEEIGIVEGSATP